MIHLGDISKIDGSKIEPVDVITFGSPCQDLSVAGKRKGLGGERSGLFMQAVRIIREMREATDGVYPNYAIWENVPGAFSSNGGRDFAAVLEELCRLCDPRARINLPDKNGERQITFAMEAGQSPTVYSMHSFGECPSVAVESRLSWILEETPHPKYFLSAKACAGVLRRAEKRGKKLPEMLKRALRAVVA